MAVIKTQARLKVAARDGKRCVRCGGGRSLHWHHRRTRRVRDDHSECTCNGVSLCTTCHSFVHANPAQAMESGLIVSRHSRLPHLHSVEIIGWGRVLLTCGGGIELVTDA